MESAKSQLLNIEAPNTYPMYLLCRRPPRRYPFNNIINFVVFVVCLYAPWRINSHNWNRIPFGMRFRYFAWNTRKSECNNTRKTVTNANEILLAMWLCQTNIGTWSIMIYLFFPSRTKKANFLFGQIRLLIKIVIVDRLIERRKLTRMDNGTAK